MSEAAENTLDDFFAKKDKKKAKAKKFTTSDEIAKKLDGKKVDKPDKPQKKTENSYQPSNQQTYGLAAETDQDEWKEIEEKEVDYSGLKIQNLQIGENRDDERDRDDYEDGDSRNKDGLNTPWKKNQSATTPESEVVVPVAESKPVSSLASTTTKDGKYVPPGKRNQSQSDAKAPIKIRGNASAPEISSELHFPSLSSAAEPAPSSSTKKAWF